jgi:hypothetical protein
MTRRQMTQFVIEQLSDTEQCSDCNGRAKFAIHGIDCISCIDKEVVAGGRTAQLTFA